VWSILRPRRYDAAVASAVLAAAASQDPMPAQPPVRTMAVGRVTRAYG